MAVTAFICLILAVPCILEIFTNPLTTFGDAGTLAAFGFLCAYYMISIAMPFYLKKRGELRARYVVLAVVACVCLAVPLEGSFYPVPPFPVDIFPYIFVAWMVVGGAWLYALSRRQPAMFGEIEADLEATMLASAQRHDEEMGKVISIERPLPPTFEELDHMPWRRTRAGLTPAGHPAIPSDRLRTRGARPVPVGVTAPAGTGLVTRSAVAPWRCTRASRASSHGAGRGPEGEGPRRRGRA